MGGGTGDMQQQHLDAAGSFLVTAEMAVSHSAATAPGAVCAFMSSSQSSGVAVGLLLEVQPRVGFLPNLPLPAPTSVILEVVQYSVANIFLLQLARTDSVLCG